MNIHIIFGSAPGWFVPCSPLSCVRIRRSTQRCPDQSAAWLPACCEVWAANEYSQFLSDIQRRRIVASVFDGYYGELTGKELIFDTNREWCAQPAEVSCIL
jgi:hypothetical protein